MPIVVSQNQHIHYQVEGDKGPVLILHGPAVIPLECWYLSKYIEQLREQYRVVIIEPLGQGASHTPNQLSYYTIESRVRHVLDITKELGIDNFHFLGEGLGALVGFWLAAYHPKRLRTLSTIEAHPYPFTNETQLLEEGIQHLKNGNLPSFIQQVYSEKQLSLGQQEAIVGGSPEAYALSLEAMIQWEGVGKQLSSITTPLLLFTATTEDRFLAIREAGRSMRYARYLILPKLKFSYGLLEVGLVVPPLVEFIRKQRWGH
ncbi:alpha/beta hydrolase [Deltaproteobacteria bacterium TL4]